MNDVSEPNSVVSGLLLFSSVVTSLKSNIHGKVDLKNVSNNLAFT